MRTPAGYIDLQVNGYRGVDFASPDLTREQLELVCRELQERGTESFLPTIITSPTPLYERNIPLISEAIQNAPWGKCMLGIHLEGPFISATPGAVGAHNPHWVQPPDLVLLERLLSLGEGTVRLLTVAAELPGVDDLIRFASSRGVTVSIGHSLFTTRDLDCAAEAGARSLTHLGNGLPNQLHRHHNPIWVGLAHDAYTAMLIADGHHLPPELLKVMIRAKGIDKVVITSDASPIAGYPPGVYDVMGIKAILEPGGRLHNPERQCLVGSTATMKDCADYLKTAVKLDDLDITQVTRNNPLQLLAS